LTKDYETVRIRIAFHPLEEKFEVANPCEFWRPKALSAICNEGRSLSLSSISGVGRRCSIWSRLWFPTIPAAGRCEPGDWTGEQKEGSNQPQRLVEARARNSSPLMLTGGMRL
jgi:hypothetical protein